MKTFDRLLLATWVLNVYDIIVTLFGTQSLEATEFNPLMRAALETGPVFFIASKLAVHSFVCWVLNRRLKGHPKKTWVTLWVIFAMFLLVSVWNTVVVLTML
jgi:hypothetical protein